MRRTGQRGPDGRVQVQGGYLTEGEPEQRVMSSASCSVGARRSRNGSGMLRTSRSRRRKGASVPRTGHAPLPRLNHPG